MNGYRSKCRAVVHKCKWNCFAYGAAFLSIVLLSVTVCAGPPYKCDDPEPPDKGRFELFFATSAASDVGGTSGGFPQLEVNFGAWKDVQLSSSLQIAYKVSKDRVITYGPGDAELAIKYRFLKEQHFFPQAALFPRVVLPLGDQKRDLGNGNFQILLPIWFQKSRGPWCAFGGGGYWINPGDGNKNWVFTGAALQRDFGEAISVGIETFFHSAATADEVHGIGMNLAFLWHLTENDHLVFSAGRDLFIGGTTRAGYMAYRKLI